jgi:hypothetical protein
MAKRATKRSVHGLPSDRKPKPKIPAPLLILGRCGTCKYWIDADKLEHMEPHKPQDAFNPMRRECWAQNPNVVLPQRRVQTGPFDLCRDWEYKDSPEVVGDYNNRPFCS